ncbi:MAG: bifunctional 3-(3-hydroxy-phenyl)propionate/3-hydroxycinnamic acid hydroxylase [Burkholderiaceae bacterium]
MSRDHLHDVLIIGLGPTGATLANLLGAMGLDTVVIDREPGFLDLPRAVHFDGEVMRVFQNMGLAAALEPHLRPSSGMQYVNAQGLLMLERKPATTQGPQGWATNYLFHQPDLEGALRRALDRFGCVTVRNSVEALGVTQQADHVAVRVRSTFSTGTEETVRARWVVGCDGARSIVREVIGGPLHDLGLHQEWLVVDVELTGDVALPQPTVQYCDPARPATFVNVTGRRRRWEIMVMPGDTPQALLEPANIWTLLAPWIRPDQARLVRSALYTFHSLIASRWRAGRLLLAGDSAHQTPPFLGQGMCAGIRDAANLAWKLAAVVRGEAAAFMLDSYESERLPHVREFIETAMRLGEIIQTTDPAVAAQRDQRFAREGTTEIVNLSPGLGPGAHTGHASAGALASQPRLADGRLLDDALAANRFALITAAPEALRASPDARAVLERLNACQLSDPALGSWLQSLGAQHALLRPDRYVAALANSAAEVASWPIAGWGYSL